MRKTDRLLILLLITAMTALTCAACQGADKKEKKQETSWYIDSKNRDNAEAEARAESSSGSTSQTASQTSGGEEDTKVTPGAAKSDQEKSDSSAGSTADTGSSREDSSQANSDGQTASGDTAQGSMQTSGTSDTKDTSGEADGEQKGTDSSSEGTGDAGSSRTQGTETGSDSDPEGSNTGSASTSGTGIDTETSSDISGQTETGQETAGETPEKDTSSDGGAQDSSEADAKAELRQQAWAATFLIWVPEFTEGDFVGVSPEDTFDYGVFENVTDRKAVDEYIALLTAQGFDDDPETGSAAPTIWYYAGNDQGWRVSVDYNQTTGILKIGSGYDDGYGSDNDDQVNKVWSTTALSLLPIPEEGILESYQGGSDSFAVFGSFSKAYAGQYVEGLKNRGFIYDVDEGESDGVQWYIAEDRDGNCAAFVYSEGVAKIMCSKLE